MSLASGAGIPAPAPTTSEATRHIHLAVFDATCGDARSLAVAAFAVDLLISGLGDRVLRRNEVERTINRLKNARAVATRYDKRAYVFHGTVTIGRPANRLRR